MKRAADAALAALGVLVVIAAVYVYAHNNSPRDGGAGASVGSRLPSSPVSSTSPGAVGTPPPSGKAPASSSSSAPRGATAKPVVAFLGDDWTAGTGLAKKAHRFSSLLSSALHVTQHNFGADGAGYGTSAKPYDDEIDAIAAVHPAMVVVSGGRNDLSPGHDLAASSHDVTQLFRDLHTRLPGATLVAVAPFWGDSDLPPALVTLSSEVKGAVTAVHGTYLDVADPIHGHPEFMANAADPNDDGHAAIAAALQPKLAALLPS